MYDFVDVISCDARLDFSRGDIEDFSRVAADFAHGVLFLLVQDRDFPLPNEDLYLSQP